MSLYQNIIINDTYNNKPASKNDLGTPWVLRVKTLHSAVGCLC